MIKTCVIGASGYAGAELVNLISQHPEMQLDALFVSESSQDAHKAFAELYGQYATLTDLALTPLSDQILSSIADQYDLIFLATPHQASHDWMTQLTGKKAVVMDLSGAFRIKDKDIFAKFYGFPHEQSELLASAVYGLAEWYAEDIATANLVAVPGCYPTASLSALKPLQQAGLLDSAQFPVINATSGVSGAGRKASMTNSLCEVSLQAYGVLGHRHQPEISAYVDQQVIFTPHLGNFKRGILATVTAKLTSDATAEAVNQAYLQAYQGSKIVRLRNSWPKLDDVVGQAYCDLHWKFDADTGYLVATSAIDNLLKGAASQAMQCANIRFGFESHYALV